MVYSLSEAYNLLCKPLRGHCLATAQMNWLPEPCEARLRRDRPGFPFWMETLLILFLDFDADESRPSWLPVRDGNWMFAAEWLYFSRVATVLASRSGWKPNN